MVSVYNTEISNMKLKEVSKVNTTKKQSKEIKERNQRMKSRSNIEKNEKEASSPPSPCTAVSPKPPPELSLGRNSLSTFSLGHSLTLTRDGGYESCGTMVLDKKAFI
jgi:hypothetical protein